MTFGRIAKWVGAGACIIAGLVGLVRLAVVPGIHGWEAVRTLCAAALVLIPSIVFFVRVWSSRGGPPPGTTLPTTPPGPAPGAPAQATPTPPPVRLEHDDITSRVTYWKGDPRPYAALALLVVSILLAGGAWWLSNFWIALGVFIAAVFAATFGPLTQVGEQNNGRALMRFFGRYVGGNERPWWLPDWIAKYLASGELKQGGLWAPPWLVSVVEHPLLQPITGKDNPTHRFGPYQLPDGSDVVIDVSYRLRLRPGLGALLRLALWQGYAAVEGIFHDKAAHILKKWSAAPTKPRTYAEALEDDSGRLAREALEKEIGDGGTAVVAHEHFIPAEWLGVDIVIFGVVVSGTKEDQEIAKENFREQQAAAARTTKLASYEATVLRLMKPKKDGGLGYTREQAEKVVATTRDLGGDADRVIIDGLSGGGGATATDNAHLVTEIRELIAEKNRSGGGRGGRRGP